MRARRSNDPRLAVAYLRVSTEEQRLGPEAQRAAIEAWAARGGVCVVAWHVDQGVSGATAIEDRPGLYAALGSLREHRAGRLVVAKRDRVARDVVIAGTVEKAVEKAGAKLVSADGASDAAGVEGLMLRGMSDLFAAVEREMIRARTRAALDAKRRRGERLGGRVPYGCRLAADGVHLEADDDEQAVIVEIRALADAGLSRRAIVSELAARGVVSRAGKPFQITQVNRIVSKGVSP